MFISWTIDGWKLGRIITVPLKIKKTTVTEGDRRDKEYRITIEFKLFFEYSNDTKPEAHSPTQKGQTLGMSPLYHVYYHVCV